MSSADYKTVAGFVQFDPKERDAGGKTVRTILVQAAGSQKDVSVTLWPEHDHVDVKAGDAIIVQGVATTNSKTNDKGEAVVYNNLSAKRFVVTGSDSAVKRDVVNRPAATDDSDDEAF